MRDAGVVDDLGRPLRFEHVLLPLDGSEFALAAMPTARALSVRFGAQLQVISVADDEADADRLVRHARASLGADLVDEQVHVVVGADPADAITARAVALGVVSGVHVDQRTWPRRRHPHRVGHPPGAAFDSDAAGRGRPTRRPSGPSRGSAASPTVEVA